MEAVLAKKNRLRLLFAELALFLRGSVISAVFNTWQLLVFPRSQKTKDRQRTKFQSLINWKSTCAVCGKELELPAGELPYRALSVGMKDIRLGSFLSRSGVSDNRGDVYGCFSSLTSGMHAGWLGEVEDRWSHSLGPFFFYFAGLYHPECKLFREKETAMHAS